MDPYTTLYPAYTPHTIPTAPTITIHALTSPPTPTPTPPLLLLHGFPQNLLIWHRVAPSLQPHYTLVLLDLRGYGKSSKPASSPPHTAYSKRTMASDCAAVMRALGHERFHVCGHDRGARVAHKLCVDSPERVIGAMLLDVAPSRAMYGRSDQAFATAYWHWYFLVQPCPFPEGVMLRGAREWVEGMLGRVRGSGGVFDEACVESYVRGVGDWETAHGMCEDYRAGAGVDLEEAGQDAGAGRVVRCPVRVLWGRSGVVGKMFDALGEWRGVCREGMVSGEAVGCGHYIPEEAPEVVVRHVLEFLKD